MGTRSAKQIVNDLACDQKVKEACRKIGGNNWEDLYQELFVILCEMDEDKLIEIESKGYLQFWIVRTLMNNITKTGKFYTKYHVTHVEGEGEKRIAEEEGEEESLFIFSRQREVVDVVLAELEAKGREGWSWYKVNLIKMYAETQSYSEISKLTGIPFVTIRNDITLFRRELAAIIHQRI